MHKAEDAIGTNDITLVDINGKEIDKSEVEKYYLVLDGQHRTLAVSIYNEWARSNGKEDVEIPAIMVELKNETIVEYINDINITKKEWGVADYVRSAANICPIHENRWRGSRYS